MLATASTPIDSDVPSAFEALVDRGHYELPVFPRVAQEVIALSSNPDAGATAVARCIEMDAALCASVLGGAASALYGGRPVRSIKQAVALLGMNEVVLLATAAAVRSSIIQPGPFLPMLTEAWRSGLATGLFAKEVARQRRANVDGAFLCGLLHSIGRPLALGLLMSIDGGASVGPETARDIVLAYEVRLGCEAVRGWALPEAVEVTIACMGGASVPEAFSDQVHTVRLAALFSQWLLSESSQDPEADPDSDPLSAALDTAPSLGLLNLYPADVESIRERGPSVLEVLEAVT